MRSGIVAVWDPDQMYTEKLSEYLRRQGGLGSTVVSFLEWHRMRQAAEQGQVSVIIMGESEVSHGWQSPLPIIHLTEERSQETPREAVLDTSTPKKDYCFYKYQPARQILSFVSDLQEQAMEWPSEATQQSNVSKIRSGIKSARVRGIYSPVGGCLKTSLGLVMGCLLAEERRCLFVSLEAHSGFRTLFGRQYPVDLSDLFARVRQKGSLTGMLEDAMQPFGKLQYIPPVIWPVDVREAEFTELKELLQWLARCGRFDEIIVDVGQDLACPEKVLQLCDQVYQPEKEDVFSRAKLAEYEAYLRISGYEVLWERTQRIPLSRLAEKMDDGTVDQWQRWEQMIPAVRQLLTEDEDEG